MCVKCAVPPLCYDFSNVATYLKRPGTAAAPRTPAVPPAPHSKRTPEIVCAGIGSSGSHARRFRAGER